MIVKDLNTMEKIVKNNNNLHWIGWDVAERKRSDLARTSANGVRVNGNWYLQHVYTLNHNGWDIPSKYRG
jgi:hypothetical protein